MTITRNDKCIALYRDFNPVSLQALSAIAPGSAVEITSSETGAGSSNNDLLSSIDLSEVFVDNSTSEVKEGVREVASKYVINGTDINKRFFNKGKKYRLLKVVKKDPEGNILDNDGIENVIRNIKLEVDSKGNMKVPNLFKIKRKKNYKNYVRRHRQIYREDLRNFHKSEKVSTTPGPRTTRVARDPDDQPEPPRVVSLGLPPLAHHDHGAPPLHDHGATPLHGHGAPPLHVVTPAPAQVHVTTLAPVQEENKLIIVSPPPAHLTEQRLVTPSGYHYTTKSSFVDVKFGQTNLLHSSTQHVPYHSTTNAPPVSHHSKINAPIRSNLAPIHVTPNILHSTSTSQIQHHFSTKVPHQSTKVVPHVVHQSTQIGPKGPKNLTIDVTTIAPHHSPLPNNKLAHLSTTRKPSFPQRVSPIPYYNDPAVVHASSVSQLSTRNRLIQYSTSASNIYATSSPFQSSTYHSKIVIKPKQGTLNSEFHKTSTTIGPALYDPKEEFILTTTTVKPTTTSSIVALSTTGPLKVAVGSKNHIDNLFEELEQGSPLTSLYDEKRNIKLIGPIAVRATGPKTFTIIDPSILEGHSPVKREYLKSLNDIQDERLKVTKRPSLRFEPENSKKTKKFMTTTWPFQSSTAKLSHNWDSKTIIDESRRWPRSKPIKPTPRVDIGVDPRHSKHVRFEDLSKPHINIKPSEFVRFPS